MDDLKMIRVQIVDRIAVVTMDNPPVNAQNAELQDEMIRAFDRISDLEEVRVSVLTGKGKCFCAGVDIKARVGARRGTRRALLRARPRPAIPCASSSPTGLRESQ